MLLRHQVALLQRQSTARPKLTWADRALFAALLAVIPRARHAGLRLPVTPATILRWHRDLVKRRWAAKSQPKTPGRPRRHPTITRLVLRMARENEHWGYRRITGELAGLGITVAPSTVWEILKKHGIDPAPRRSGPTWARVPALPGRGDHRVRLLHRRPARRHQGLRAGRDRARHPAHPHPGRHRASHRASGSPSRPATC